MKHLIFIFAWLVLLGFGCESATAQKLVSADFYVAANGSDEWSGTLASPAAGDADRPFASLERARDAVRELKKSKSADIVVLVRGGTYPLQKTVVFGIEDSGEGESTTAYVAYLGEKPVFTSGREIKGWKPVVGELRGLPKETQKADCRGRARKASSL